MESLSAKSACWDPGTTGLCPAASGQWHRSCMPLFGLFPRLWGSGGPSPEGTIPARGRELSATRSQHSSTLLGSSWPAQCPAHLWWFPWQTAQDYEKSNQKTSCFKWTILIHSTTWKHFWDRIQRNRACFYKTKFSVLADLPPSLIVKQISKTPQAN